MSERRHASFPLSDEAFRFRRHGYITTSGHRVWLDRCPEFELHRNRRSWKETLTHNHLVPNIIARRAVDRCILRGSHGRWGSSRVYFQLQPIGDHDVDYEATGRSSPDVDEVDQYGMRAAHAV